MFLLCSLPSEHGRRLGGTAARRPPAEGTRRRQQSGRTLRAGAAPSGGRRLGLGRGGAAAPRRSEEHTSELQSLMRISYAVFCLKKKKTTTQHNATHTDNRTIYSQPRE